MSRQHNSPAVGASPSSTARPRSGTASVDDEYANALAFRVMRLTRPEFKVVLPALRGGMDPPSTDALALGMNDTLILPAGFGSIYIGETFRAFVCLSNTIQTAVSDVVLKVEIQSGNKRTALHDNSSSPTHLLSPGKKIDMGVDFALEESGVHVLICSATYRSPSGAAKSVRQFFKFNVSEPFRIDPKLSVQGHSVLIEATIRNTTRSRPLLVEDGKFLVRDPSICQVEDIRKPHREYIAVDEVVSYLFRLTFPNKDTLYSRCDLGWLELSWRGSGGDPGRIRAEVRVDSWKRVAGKGPEISLVSVPNRVILEEDFAVRVRVSNRGDSSLRLRVLCERSEDGGVHPFGRSDFAVGEVASGDSKDIDLSLIPIYPGVQKLANLFVVDEDSPSQKISLAETPDIFVEQVHDEDQVQMEEQ